MRRWVVCIMALSLGLVFQSRPVLSSETEASPLKHYPTETPFILKSAAEAISAQLQALDQDLAEAARRLSAVDLKSDAARGVIRQLQARAADIVIDACTISPQRVMLLVEPAPNRYFLTPVLDGQKYLGSLLIDSEGVGGLTSLWEEVSWHSMSLKEKDRMQILMPMCMSQPGNRS